LGEHIRKRTLALRKEDQHNSKNIKGTPKHNTMRSTLGKRIDATRSIRQTPPPPKFTTRR
jgi:hypothetical protein